MNFIDLFSGIGGFRLGMEKAGHKCLAFAEIDKFAVRSYKAMYDTEGEKELGDVTGISNDDIRLFGESNRIDVICGGFPCQAFSIAGKRRGFKDTRGTLFFEIARLASILKPKYLFLENVKGLLNHNRGGTFKIILETLDELGYDVEWQVLNSKYFGVPQNRERVFIIGHLRGGSTRPIFPIRRTSGENSLEIVATTHHNYNSTKDIFSTRGISPAVCSRDYKGAIKVAGVWDRKNHESANRIYDPVGIGPTVSTCRSGGSETKIVLKIKEATKKGYSLAKSGDSINLEQPNSKTRRGRVGRQVANTLTTSGSQGVVANNLMVRKLTPREYFRLQGFPDELFDKAQEVNSNSQLYKQAGNSVTVNVIYEIAKRLK